MSGMYSKAFAETVFAKVDDGVPLTDSELEAVEDYGTPAMRLRAILTRGRAVDGVAPLPPAPPVPAPSVPPTPASTAERLADVIVDTVKRAIAPIRDRLAILEAAVPVRETFEADVLARLAMLETANGELSDRLVEIEARQAATRETSGVTD